MQNYAAPKLFYKRDKSTRPQFSAAQRYARYLADRIALERAWRRMTQ